MWTVIVDRLKVLLGKLGGEPEILLKELGDLNGENRDKLAEKILLLKDFNRRMGDILRSVDSTGASPFMPDKLKKGPNKSVKKLLKLVPHLVDATLSDPVLYRKASFEQRYLEYIAELDNFNFHAHFIIKMAEGFPCYYLDGEKGRIVIALSDPQENKLPLGVYSLLAVLWEGVNLPTHADLSALARVGGQYNGDLVFPVVQWDKPPFDRKNKPYLQTKDPLPFAWGVGRIYIRLSRHGKPGRSKCFKGSWIPVRWGLPS